MSGESRTHELLTAARNGDPQACDRLFARVADRLLLFVRLRLGPALRARVDSMDVLQETFLHAHRDLARFEPSTGDPERGFAQWLCGVAENRIKDLAALHGAKRRDPKREERKVSEVLATLQRAGHGPATSLVRREERHRLAEAVEALDDEDREVLVLRHFGGLSLDAIAARLSRSASAVRRALGRATRDLGKALGAKETS